MAIIEVVSGGDRRSLMKRFERKSKQQAISELVDFHLLNCARIENLEQQVKELENALARVAELERQEPVAFTTPGMLEVAKQLPLTGRVGARCKRDKRWCVPLYTAPAAQAQHSVPEGFREKFEQCMELAFAEIAQYVSPEKARDTQSRARRVSTLATELRAMLAAAPVQGGPRDA
ncbi:TPA: hypothetical protein NIA54_002198 [Pseudomonas aeruginosa]|nr:hypothetical protein [Pseudomonas aeruginosa]